MNKYVGELEKLTLSNGYFRQVLFTAKHAQLVVMCLQPGEDIDDEVHPDVDQFFRIEKGEARFVFDEKEERLVHDGGGVVVPAGTYHNVINASKYGTAEAIHDLLSAEPSGRNGAQDQGRRGGGREVARRRHPRRALKTRCHSEAPKRPEQWRRYSGPHRSAFETP
jgi:mannose-6-phosphate isomerase-like protein (cupin superfamily)